MLKQPGMTHFNAVFKPTGSTLVMASWAVGTCRSKPKVKCPAIEKVVKERDVQDLSLCQNKDCTLT